MIFVVSTFFILGILVLPSNGSCTNRTQQHNPKSFGSEKRIYNGYDSSLVQVPYITQLRSTNRFKCGAVVWNKFHLLTAAHCVYNSDSYNWPDLPPDATIPLKSTWVAVGLEEANYLINAADYDPGFVKYGRRVSALIGHPKYDHDIRVAKFDIAIVKLQDPLEYGQLVQPILPFEKTDATGFKAIIAGWGETTKDSLPSEKLQVAEVTILSNRECRKGERNPEKLDAGIMFCAKNVEGKVQNPCPGDSGGPIACIISTNSPDHGNFEEKRLCGINHMAPPCGEAYASTYTKVFNPEIMSWILKVAGPGDKPTRYY